MGSKVTLEKRKAIAVTVQITQDHGMTNPDWNCGQLQELNLGNCR